MYTVTIMYFGATERYECKTLDDALAAYANLIQKHQYNKEVLCEVHIDNRIYKHYYRVGSEEKEILCD